MTRKQKGDPVGKISQGAGRKKIAKGEPHAGGEFLSVTGPEKQIPTDTELTRVPRLASYLLRPISCLPLEFLSRIHYNSYKFNSLVFF